MNEFRKRSDGSVVLESVFRNTFPEVAFPATLDAVTLGAHGYDPVLATNPPTTEPGFTAVRNGVTLDSNSHWVFAWLIKALDVNLATNALKSAQAEMWARIQVERDRRETGGVKVDGHWFHTDTPSLVKYLSLRAAGDALPEGIEWKTMDGTMVPMSPELVNEIYLSAMSASNTVFAAGEVHKAAMMLLPVPMSYVFSSGWPDIYVAPEPVVLPAVPSNLTPGGTPVVTH